MTKARRKGRQGEKYFLPFVTRLWPDARMSREELGPYDWGDYEGTSLLVEAKFTKNTGARFLDWARTARRKSERLGPKDGRWIVLWTGDKRTAEGQPVAMMDPEFAEELLQCWLVLRANS